MGLPQGLGKPDGFTTGTWKTPTGFTTLPTPLRSPPFSPPTFSLSRGKNILGKYPYRGLRLSKSLFSLFSCYYSLSERDLQALRTGFLLRLYYQYISPYHSSMPPMPRWCCCCSCCRPISGLGSSSLAFSSNGSRRSGKRSSK